MDTVKAGNRPRINSQARGGNGLSGTVCATHATPPVQFKAWPQTTVVSPGPQRAFRLPDPRQISRFTADGLEGNGYGVGFQLAPSSSFPSRSSGKRQDWSQCSPHEVMFPPPDYSPQSPSTFPGEVMSYPTSVVTASRRTEEDISREHGRYARQQYSPSSINVGRPDQFESPELPPLSSPGTWSQPSPLDDRSRWEHEEDPSLRPYGGAKADQAVAASEPASQEVAACDQRPRHERGARDESITSQGHETGGTNILPARGDRSSGNVGELGDAYRLLLAGARDGSNNVSGMKPSKTSSWMKDAAPGAAPKNIPLRRKPCEVPGCRVQPSYGPRGTTRPRFCTGHKTKGMVGLKNRPCLFSGCTTRPHYGLPAGRALFCASHKREGMVHLFKGAATRKATEGHRKNHKNTPGVSSNESKEIDTSGGSSGIEDDERRARPTSGAEEHQAADVCSGRGSNYVKQVRTSSRPVAGRGGKDKQGRTSISSQEGRAFPAMTCHSSSSGQTSSLSFRMPGPSPSDAEGERDRYCSSSRAHRTENIVEGSDIRHHGEMERTEQTCREDDQRALEAKAAWRKERGFRHAFSARMIQAETPASKAARPAGESTSSQKRRETAI